MRSRSFLLAFVGFLSPVLPLSAAPLDVTLAASPSRTLAGIPVSLGFVFTNRSNVPVAIPKRAVLAVHSSRDSDFLASCDQARVVLKPAWGDVVVPPQKSVTEELSTDGSLLTPAWFLDSRLLAPGTYTLQVYFGDRLANSSSLDQVRLAGVASTPATLTVAEPAGDDAKVWAMLMTLGRPWGPTRLATRTGAAVARRIVADFPRSAYAGWIAATTFSGPAEDRAALLRTWLGTASPDDPYYEWRLLKLAVFDVAVWDELERSAPAKAREHGALARASLQRLVQQTHNDAIKRAALDRLDYLNDDDSQ